jgi:hypothetical protein
LASPLFQRRPKFSWFLYVSVYRRLA